MALIGGLTMIDYAGPGMRDTRWRRVRRSAPLVLLRVGITLLGLALIAGLTAAFHYGVSPATAYIGFFAAMLFLGGLAAARTRARRRRGRIVLGHLGQSASLALPIPQMLRAAAESESASVGRRLLRVAEGVEQGGGLASVLTANLPELPPRALSLVAVAESNGTLSKGIDAALDAESHDDPAEEQRESLVMPMLLATLFVGMNVAVLITIYVVPKFETIFRDLGVGAPTPLRTLIRVSHVLYSLAPLFVLLAGLWLLWFASRNGWALLFDVRAREPGWLARGIQRLRWVTPLLGRMDRDRGWADALPAVADAVVAGRPLPGAIRESAMPHLNIVLRERLRDWAEAIERGTPFTTAARDATMPRTLCDLLTTARDTDSVAAALRFAAVTSAERWARHAAWCRAFGQVTLTLLLGMLVAAMGFALFDTMTTLMHLFEPVFYQYP